MRTFWNEQVGPKSNNTCPYETEKRRRSPEGCLKREAEMGPVRLQAWEQQGVLAASTSEGERPEPFSL